MIGNSITKMHSSICSHTDKTKGEGGFTENTGTKRVKSFRVYNFNHRIIFALLWANFSPAASQWIPAQPTA